MDRIFLQNEELRLRAVEPEDLELLYRAENDSSIWWLGGHTGPYSRFMLRRYLEDATGDIYTDKQLRLMVERRTDGEVMGMVDLFDFCPRHHRAEIGILLFESYRGMGYFGQILDLVSDYAASHLHLHQLYAYVPAGNQRCYHAFVGQGFLVQHMLKEWISHPDGYDDVWLMQKILSEEVKK